MSMRIKYHVSDLENLALREKKHLDEWLQENPEYVTKDGVIYYEEFKKVS